ncbi:MAG: hypothetical protein ACRERU_00305 [Methylococcales bacterium]
MANKDLDEQYLALIIDAIKVCASYRPKLGHGQKGGFSLSDFRAMYGADPFYSWFGLDSPLMYAAHKAAGGMTSVYRQIGIGGQWLFNRILCDHLGLSEGDANWSYTVPGTRGHKRKLSLDARIPVTQVIDRAKRDRIEAWLDRASKKLALNAKMRNSLGGAVFEVRQGYKSKDSKRQNADIANASNAYAHQYLPVVVLLSTQIDSDVAERYQRARWLVLTGTMTGTDVNSTYAFTKDVVGYDLAAFFKRNSATLKKQVETVLRSLLREK